jgi:hypothetical protein
MKLLGIISVGFARSTTDQIFAFVIIKKLKADLIVYKSNFVFFSAVKSVQIRICKTMILPMVLYGCETLLLAVREEHRVSMFQDRVMRIFGLKRDEMTAGWRELHDEKLHNLNSS